MSARWWYAVFSVHNLQCSSIVRSRGGHMICESRENAWDLLCDFFIDFVNR